MQAGIIKNSVVLEQMQQSKKAEADAVFAQTQFRRKATPAARPAPYTVHRSFYCMHVVFCSWHFGFTSAFCVKFIQYSCARVPKKANTKTAVPLTVTVSIAAPPPLAAPRMCAQGQRACITPACWQAVEMEAMQEGDEEEEEEEEEEDEEEDED